MFTEVCDGLSKEIERDGDPEHKARTGCHVALHFRCEIAATGETVDSSRGEQRSTVNGITVLKQNHPLQFTLGEGTHVKGFVMAVETMALGERATFKVRSDLAYASRGKGEIIPPDADLEFDIEVLGIDKVYAKGITV